MNDDIWWAYPQDEVWKSTDGTSVRVSSSSRQAVEIEVTTPKSMVSAIWDPQVETLSILGEGELEKKKFELIRGYISSHSEPYQLHATAQCVIDLLADVLIRETSVSMKVVRQQLAKNYEISRQQANRVVQQLTPRFAALGGEYLTLQPLGLLRSKRSDDVASILSTALAAMRAAFDENAEVFSMPVDRAFGDVDEDRKRFILRVLYMFKLASSIQPDGKGTWNVPQDIEELWGEKVRDMAGFWRFTTIERRVPRPWPGALLREDWKGDQHQIYTESVAVRTTISAPSFEELVITGRQPDSKSRQPMFGDWREIRALTPDGQGDVRFVERVGDKGHALGVLKRLPEAFAGDAKRVIRLKHEIETVRALNHPFIAELLDWNSDELWFVTRYAPYGSLAEHLAWFKGDVFRTLRMARDVALALQSAHEKGVIHRDVKPGNILLYDPNHCALTDFGIAHDDDQTEVTATAERVGASWFRPPEAESGRYEPTPAFDVYMLGKVVYVALSGGGRFLREHFQQGLADLAAELGRPDLASTHKLLEKMIVEDPSRRMQSMREVIDSLDATLARVLSSGSCSCDHGNRLIFMFGDSSGQRYSGDHAGLQMVSIWIPQTNRLTIEIRLHSMPVNARYGVELWKNESKIFDSGTLSMGRSEHAIQVEKYGCWASLRVRPDSGFGSAYISNLVVHAAIGGGDQELLPE